MKVTSATFEARLLAMSTIICLVHYINKNRTLVQIKNLKKLQNNIHFLKLI